jgi:hypothetical protein
MPPPNTHHLELIRVQRKIFSVIPWIYKEDILIQFTYFLQKHLDIEKYILFFCNQTSSIYLIIKFNGTFSDYRLSISGNK